jgi:hypothetical protein
MDRVFPPVNQNLAHPLRDVAPYHTAHPPVETSLTAGTLHNNGGDGNVSGFKKKIIADTYIGGIEQQLLQGFGAMCIDVEPRMYVSIACMTEERSCAKMMFF